MEERENTTKPFPHQLLCVGVIGGGEVRGASGACNGHQSLMIKSRSSTSNEISLSGRQETETTDFDDDSSLKEASLPVGEVMRAGTKRRREKSLARSRTIAMATKFQQSTSICASTRTTMCAPN